MSQPCGHVDFYPNNGKEQPGCSGTDAPLPLTLIREGLEEASRVLVACSHVRAIKLFTDSINTPCPYIAHKCDSYEHFLEVSARPAGPRGPDATQASGQVSCALHMRYSRGNKNPRKSMPFSLECVR